MYMYLSLFIYIYIYICVCVCVCNFTTRRAGRRFPTTRGADSISFVGTSSWVKPHTPNSTLFTQTPKPKTPNPKFCSP